MQARTNAYFDPFMNWEAKDKIDASLPELSQVDRLEVIDNQGRSFVITDVLVDLHLQDDGKTLKIFVEERETA